MSLLLDTGALHARSAIARGSLAPLARGLRAELALVLTGAIEIPREKALLSRTGGRCPNDGTFLRFDPLDPRLFHVTEVHGVVDVVHCVHVAPANRNVLDEDESRHRMFNQASSH